jgi:hypothetical protein
VTTDHHSNFFEYDLLKSESAEEVILCLKRHFARYGIPQSVISDNGPQFSSSMFRKFAAEWKFEWQPISPGNSQGNGLAEVAVRSVKNLLRKADHTGEDPYIGLLNIRNTLTEGLDTLPAQRLLGRATQTFLPAKLQGHDFSAKEALAKDNAHLKRHSSGKEMAPLTEGTFVRVQPIDGAKIWQEGRIKQRISGRAYETTMPNGKVLRRNRRMLRCKEKSSHSFPPLQPMPMGAPGGDPQKPKEGPETSTADPRPPAPTEAESPAVPVVTLSGRHVQKPKYLKDFV